MGDIIGWIIIGLVIAFILWRIVTARYRVRRKMLEQQQEEKDELRILNEWARRDSAGKPYKLRVVRRGETPEQKDEGNAGTTKIQ